MDLLCEFIEINETGEFIGAFHDTLRWRDACQKPATYTFHFANHISHLCKLHHERLIKWMVEDE